MAKYYYTTHLNKAESSTPFSGVNNIGTKPSYPGIYKCQSCGFEDVINRECEKFPPCSNCSKKNGTNTWKLLVQAADK